MPHRPVNDQWLAQEPSLLRTRSTSAVRPICIVTTNETDELGDEAFDPRTELTAGRRELEGASVPERRAAMSEPLPRLNRPTPT